MRWLTFILPLGVAIAVLPDLRDLAQSGLAILLVSGIGVVGLVLAALGARVTRSPGPRRPGTFVLCWILGGLAFWRVTTAIVFAGAHTVLDVSSLQTDLLNAWFTLLIGILAGVAGITVGRPSGAPRRAE